MEALGRRGYPSDILRIWKKQVCYEDRAWTLSKKKTLPRGIPLMLPSEYDEIWEYADMSNILQVMKREWEEVGEIPTSLQGPLIKSLRRTDNLFDKLSVWNKAILKGRSDSAVGL